MQYYTLFDISKTVVDNNIDTTNELPLIDNTTAMDIGNDELPTKRAIKRPAKY